MITLKKIRQNNVSPKWVSWLNNKKVNRYSNQRFIRHTITSQNEFIKKKIKDKNSLMYGIYLNNEHIGIIELTKIDLYHKNCIVSFMLGNHKYWGKGITSEALNQIIKIGFDKLKLKKITSSIYSENIASEKVMMNNGFKIEGIVKNFYKFGIKRMDKKILGICEKEYKMRKRK